MNQPEEWKVSEFCFVSFFRWFKVRMLLELKGCSGW